MNYNEAKDYFKSLLATYEENNCAMHPAYESAIEGLEKLELIDNWIDTDEAIVIAELVHRYGINAVKEACEKQIPKKPINFSCPVCSHYFEDSEPRNYCPDCGQRLE